ncbi:PRC-barrel domain-containing protein [Anaerosalibacter massiliensis]|uniref:PRC-barrel domain-containing protein n=1 Tax=Anaerosalibacter massiliensis TaxID=1347392 RepID=A0A9X2S5R0_9FIRM|nr:PRC-barrel domain-containing protein [Anaerosalibacter massiliensis]MCR2042842.1 PRC-barrel domain-containing protein [Anaerosalibacter massiliensis]
MIRYKDLIGANVVEEKNGEKIGEISDVIFTDDFEKFIGFLIEDGKFLKQKKKIFIDDILSFGKDVIIIDSEKVLSIKKNNVNEGITGEDIKFIDKEILTENGECLGYIKDLLFNYEKEKLIGYIITEGIIEDITKGRSFVPNLSNIKINKENLIVGNEVKYLISKNKEHYKKLLELIER